MKGAPCFCLLDKRQKTGLFMLKVLIFTGKSTLFGYILSSKVK